MEPPHDHKRFTLLQHTKLIPRRERLVRRVIRLRREVGAQIRLRRSRGRRPRREAKWRRRALRMVGCGGHGRHVGNSGSGGSTLRTASDGIVPSPRGAAGDFSPHHLLRGVAEKRVDRREKNPERGRGLGARKRERPEDYVFTCLRGRKTGGGDCVCECVALMIDPIIRPIIEFSRCEMRARFALIDAIGSSLCKMRSSVQKKRTPSLFRWGKNPSCTNSQTTPTDHGGSFVHELADQPFVHELADPSCTNELPDEDHSRSIASWPRRSVASRSQSRSRFQIRRKELRKLIDGWNS